MSDYIVHASGAGNQVRIFAASTRDLVEKAREIHNTSPVATAALGTSSDCRCHDGQHDEGRKGSSDTADSVQRANRRTHGDGKG